MSAGHGDMTQGRRSQGGPPCRHWYTAKSGVTERDLAAYHGRVPEAVPSLESGQDQACRG
jgi:hypothetical protein